MSFYMSMERPINKPYFQIQNAILETKTVKLIFPSQKCNIVANLRQKIQIYNSNSQIFYQFPKRKI